MLLFKSLTFQIEMDEKTDITESLIIIIVTKGRMMQSCSVTHYSLLFVFLQIFQEGLFSQWAEISSSRGGVQSSAGKVARQYYLVINFLPCWLVELLY